MAWVGAALMALIGVAISVCVVKIRHGTLHRNAFMGIRVPATSVSEEAWDAAHHVALPWWTVVAVGFVVAAVMHVDDDRVMPRYIGPLGLVAILAVIPVPAAVRAARAVPSS